MPNIQVGADFSKVEQASNQFVSMLQRLDSNIATVTSRIVKFNAVGEQTGAVVRGLTADGQKYVATLAQVKQFDSTGKLIGKNLEATSIAFQQVAKDGKTLGDELTKNHEKASLFDKVLARLGRSLQYFLTFKAFSAINNNIEDGIRLAKDFQIQISLIRTISQDAQQTFGQFGRDIRGVSDRSGLDLKQVGKAFYDTISNQIAKGADTAPFVETATKLAKVTGSEVTDAVNILSSAINSYGLSTKDATVLSAEFFKVVDEGRIVLGELANTGGRIFVLGANLGIARQELQSTLAITTQKGLKTSDAVTLLTNLLIKLEKPTEATAAFFKSLGVSSGEAAIQLFGFTGVLRKMVEAVQSGQVDVSAFFDEIRGRKQFGVFQQSIDQIEKFSDSLKDVGKTVQEFNNAVTIRGESPAQKLVEELNKVKNIFTVDFGQNILNLAANITEAVGGVDALTGSGEKLVKGFTTSIIALGAYRLAMRAIGAEALIAGASLTTLGASLARIGLFIAPVAIAATTFTVFKNLFDKGSKLFDGIDTKKFETSVQLLENYKKRIAALSDKPITENLFKGIDDQKKIVDDTFKGLLQLIANANIANNKFLDDARQKAKDVAESLKISFASFTDTLKQNISEIGKQITEAKNELEKSAKSITSFGKSISDTIFNTKFKFATDAFGGTENQKIQLLTQRIGILREEAQKLFKTGNTEDIAQARKLYDDIVKLEEQRFDLITEAQKKQFETDLRSGRTRPNQFGPNVFTVQTTELQKRLNQLLQERNALEDEYRGKQAKAVADKQNELAAEQERLRKLEAAFKSLTDLDPFNKEGKIKQEFRDPTGKLDQSKFLTELNKINEQIRANAGGDFNSRFELEVLLNKFKATKIAELAAQDRKEYLDTIETKNQADKERLNKELERIKQGRQAAIDSQNQVIVELQNKTAELEAFANKLFSGKTIAKGVANSLTDGIKAYGRLIEDIKNNPIAGPDGIPILDPEKLKRAEDTYKSLSKTILGLRGQSGPSLEITPGLTPASGITALEETLNKAKKVAADLETFRSREAGIKGLFDLNITGPFDALKAQFPELATSAATAFDGINAKVKNLATDGLEQLKQKLLELQKLMQNVGGGPNNVSTNFNGDATYAATGGVVGLFPGQPRGQDVYPIWAAKDETIISAATSRMYKPMLQAIMSRQMPRYMNQGGVVGDNTNVGDINISVQGATTNNETARVIGNQLERQLRRRNIRL